MEPNGTIRFHIETWTGTGDDKSTRMSKDVSTAFPLGKRVHVAAVFDNDAKKMTIYIDGIAKTSANTGSVTPYGKALEKGQNAGIGVGNASGWPHSTKYLFPLDGSIEGLRLIAGALDPTEIKNSAQGGVTHTPK